MSDVNFSSVDCVDGIHTTTWSGIWASAQSGNVQYKKIGNLVILKIPTIQVAYSSGTFASIDTNLPAILRPSADIYFGIRTLDQTSTRDWGLMTVETTGNMALYQGIEGGASSYTSGTCGCYAIDLTYLV